MGAIASQITSLAIVYSTVYSDADQRKHQSSASLAFVWGIHRDRWIPRTKGQLRGKCFHLMTSSWSHYLSQYWLISIAPYGFTGPQWSNSLRPRQNGRYFPDDIFECIFFNEKVWTLIKISLKFVSKGPISIILALVQIMARRRSGDKPLSEPMLVRLPMHICVTRPQWVNLYASVNWVIIISENGLSPVQHQAIVSTSTDVLSIGPLGTNFSEIQIKVQQFSYKTRNLKMSSAKHGQFCLDLNVFKTQ